MPDIRDALAELRRLGMHLDPRAAAEEAESRYVRLNTRTYALYRAIGFQILLLIAIAHNAAVFGEVGWRALLIYGAGVQLYVLLTWLLVRRWFTAFTPMGDWDLADFVFLADLAMWAWAIIITGADRSWLFLLPLLRVADHRAERRVYAFALLAPLSYLAVPVWAELQAGRAVAWDNEAVKIGLLAAAGLYIAFTGGHAHRLKEQRAAAVELASQLVAKLRERTERLDHANRVRGDLLTRIRNGLGTPLVEIVGFSQSLIRGAANRSAAEEDYLHRIHRQARWILRILDDLADLPDLTASWPRVSLNGVIQEAAAREAAPEEPEGARRDPARLNLVDGDLEIRTDPRQLSALLQHLLSAGRHFGGAPPEATLRLDPATRLPEAIDVVAAVRIPVATAASARHSSDLLNPFSAAATGDHQEMGARFELNLARSIAELLGYRLEVSSGPSRLQLTLRLR